MLIKINNGKYLFKEENVTLWKTHHNKQSSYFWGKHLHTIRRLAYQHHHLFFCSLSATFSWAQGKRLNHKITLKISDLITYIDNHCHHMNSIGSELLTAAILPCFYLMSIPIRQWFQLKNVNTVDNFVWKRKLNL